MDKIHIDLSHFLASKQLMPLDSHRGNWTFLIDGRAWSIFGTFDEAKTLARLYVRMHDTGAGHVVLNGFEAAGTIRDRIN